MSATMSATPQKASHFESRSDEKSFKIQKDDNNEQKDDFNDEIGGSSPSSTPSSNSSLNSLQNSSQESLPLPANSFLSIQGRDIKDAPRKRRRTTPNELHVLEAEFSRNSRPGKMDRERIAKLTSMDEKAVQVWFQNKRQSHRRQHNLVTPAAVRTQSLPIYNDENRYMRPPVFYPNFPVPQKFHPNQVFVDEAPKPGPKSLRLSMSADGKAELIERSPLKQISPNHQNHQLGGLNVPNAAKFASMPAYQPVTGIEQECASSLLVLKFGKWA